MGNARTRIEWGEAFAEELGVIKARRPGDDQGKVEGDLVGLAFSGGGIRSATFGLGVLEALRELGLLKKVDYLSTVSGGGYIGAWLSANCLRAKAREVDWLDPKADWQDSIRHLRRYSNYLSPQVGFFSADTWTIGTVWLRNTMLIQMTVILAIAVVLLLPRPLHGAFERQPKRDPRLGGDDELSAPPGFRRAVERTHRDRSGSGVRHVHQVASPALNAFR